MANARKVRVRDVELDVVLPALDLREDLCYSWAASWRRNKHGLPLMRISAAAVALCLPEVAFHLRGIGANPREDLYAYGAEVYVKLKEERSWGNADVMTAGEQLVSILHGETFPRQDEVNKARGNSERGAASSEKPSA